jgi:hypothetical protein
LLLLAALLGSPAAARSTVSASAAAPSARVTPAPASVSHPPSTLTAPVPASFTDPALDLRAGPVDTPIELELPSLAVRATVVGVGITPTDVMDAPMGPADDPVWQQAFWYRGSAVPGAASTALIAGHVDDPLGRPGVFARLDQLDVGDPVVVHDTRNGLDVRFTVTEVATYTLDEASDPAVLAHIYGDGPVAGVAAQPSADGGAHLTLITCAGTFRNGTHDHRLVVYASRTE